MKYAVQMTFIIDAQDEEEAVDRINQATARAVLAGEKDLEEMDFDDAWTAE